MGNDVPYAVKQSQMQRALGELKVLYMLYYNPYRNKEEYTEIRKMIEEFDGKLTDNFG